MRPSRTVQRIALRILLCLGMCSPAVAIAQGLPTSLEAPEAAATAAAEVEVSTGLHRLTSPQTTMHTFLTAMSELWSRPGAWEEAVACLDLTRTDPEVHRERARQLYGVLNRVALVDVTSLPDDADERSLEQVRYFPDPSRDRALLRRVGVPAGELVLAKGSDGGWRFSARTVATLPALAAQLEDEPLVAGEEILTVSDWLESRLPRDLVDNTFLAVKYWAWLAIFAVIVLGLLVDLLARALVRNVSHRFAGKTGGEEDPEELRRALRPVGWTAAAIVWLLPIGILDLDPAIETILGGALKLFLVLMATLSAWRVIDLASSILVVYAERTESRVDDILVPLVSRAIKLFVLTMGVVYGADALDLPIAPLLASLTVAGVGFSFAAKDTVENFFGSVAVVLDRPFDIGDWVVIDGTEGIVERVGFRSTRVRTFYNSQITVPNSNLVRAVVDNYGRRQYRRWKTTLALQYDTTPEKLVAFTEGVRELIRLHPFTRKDYFQVWCNEFGASSLDIMLYMFFEVPDWNTELRERERLFIDIVRLADQLGVSFAYPTQTVHVQPVAAPEAPAAPPVQDTESLAARAGVAAGRAIVREQPWRRQKPGPVVFETSPGVGFEHDAAGNPVEPSASGAEAAPSDEETP